MVILMSEKRFYLGNDEWVKFDYSEIREYIDEEPTPNLLRNDEVCDLLNECQSIISALKEENERLKKRLYLYEINEDEVDKYLRTHPMPTITNERTIIPLNMRHRW